VSFAGEPGRDDGNLPPLNVVIPDDARELERDVLAYRREMRAQRRRRRLAWLVRPFNRPGSGGPAAIVPLIAACLALSLVGGALLSVVTMSPASEPTPGPQASAGPTVSLTTLRPVDVESINERVVPVRSLVTSAIALVPPNCGCGPALHRLAGQAKTAQVGLYFVGTTHALQQVITLAEKDGAMALYDPGDVLGTAYKPVGLTVLFVFHDATAEIARDVSGDFDLDGTLVELRSMTASKAAAG
jgi:hypothetical protein